MQDDPQQIVIAVEPSKILGKVVVDVCKRRGLLAHRFDDIGGALAAIAYRKPAAILTSLDLPGFSGMSLIAALKSSPRHSGIPVGLMTSADALDRPSSASPPEALIRKTSSFARDLEQFLTTYRIGGKKAADGNSTGVRLNGKILLAEDTWMIQKLISTFLRAAGAEVMTVENGAEAVAAASAKRFDLILLDIEMPVMNGREAVAKIRADGITVPILASTAHDGFGDEAQKLGFDGVLTKPVVRQMLIDTCAKYMVQGIDQSSATSRPWA